MYDPCVNMDKSLHGSALLTNTDLFCHVDYGEDK